MFMCIKCNQNLPDGANFCPQCGKRVGGESDRFAVQQRLIEISQAMNCTLDLDILLRDINIRARELTRAETGSTLLFDSDKNELYFKVALGEKAAILRRLSITDGVAWWVFTNSRPAIVNDTSSDLRFTGTVDKVTSFSTRSILCVPIVLTSSNAMKYGSSTRVIGVIEAINKLSYRLSDKSSDPPRFTVEDQRVLSILAYQAAIAVRNAQAAGDRRNFFVNAIEMFMTAIESTRCVPLGHCMKVSRISMGMAHRLDVEYDDFHNLYYASALHDIGVLDIRCTQDPISNMNCPKSHTLIGAEVVRPVNLLARTEPIIRHHHEAWDGSGYPDGIGGYEIPLGARIVAVAEAYEENGAGREFITVNSGKLFDPDVVDAFLKTEV